MHAVLTSASHVSRAPLDYGEHTPNGESTSWRVSALSYARRADYGVPETARKEYSGEERYCCPWSLRANRPIARIGRSYTTLPCDVAMRRCHVAFFPTLIQQRHAAGNKGPLLIEYYSRPLNPISHLSVPVLQ